MNNKILNEEFRSYKLKLNQKTKRTSPGYVYKAFLTHICNVIQKFAETNGIKQSTIKLEYLPCGPSMMDYPETCWRPPESGCGGFRQVSEFFISLILFSNFNKKRRKPARTAVAGFRRFPEVSGGFQIIHN